MHSVWTVILAGGEGQRIAALTRDRFGESVPKQFFEFCGERSLLSQTLDRARRVTGPDHLLVAVQENQRRWWTSECFGLDASSVLVEPANRGTGVAILHAACRTLEAGDDAWLLVLPSDHAVENEGAWERTLRRTLEAAMSFHETPVLVGMEPTDDDGYGWIVPGTAASPWTRRIAAFVEKPPAGEVQALRRRGALVSTFVFAASAVTLLGLYQRHAPVLVARFASCAAAWHTAPQLRADAFASLPCCDFSRDILEDARGELHVLRGEPCGWSDLGTPARLERWQRRRGFAPQTREQREPELLPS